jgi:hypothetical protein
MKYIKTSGEIKLNEDHQEKNVKLEKSILKIMRLSPNSMIIPYEIYPLDKWVEKKIIGGLTVLVRLNDDASVHYRVI